MSTLSPWSPYVKRYWPSVIIKRRSDWKPVADVDTILWIDPGYTGVMLHSTPSGGGMSGAMPEGVVYPRFALFDQGTGKVVAIVEGVGKVYPGFAKRPVTPVEAALSGDEGGIF